jgi:hypothetical protein
MELCNKEFYNNLIADFYLKDFYFSIYHIHRFGIIASEIFQHFHLICTSF